MKQIIIKKGIVLTTALGTSDKKLDDLELFTISSTDIEDVRRKLMTDFDHVILGHLNGEQRTEQVELYLENRNNKKLTEWYRRYF